jgi:DNA-binding response OmpR family regulator
VLAAIRRARPALPVIVLTARGEVEDRVAGLDAGAVDYLVKPFSMAELIARVRAHLRLMAEASATTLNGAGLDVDLLSREVRFEGEPVLLSTTEFELLVFMLRHHGEVLSREQILSAVWGYAHDPATNVVDVYIGYLRRKLARDDGTTPIFTVRSVGYRLGGAEE